MRWNVRRLLDAIRRAAHHDHYHYERYGHSVLRDGARLYFPDYFRVE